MEYVFTVRNDSGGPITIPACETSVGPRGIVPASQPDAELWLNVTVDCGGPRTIATGDEESWTETVYARDKYGTAYEPGPHLVGRKVRGVQERLLVPITVVASNAPSSSLWKREPTWRLGVAKLLEHATAADSRDVHAEHRLCIGGSEAVAPPHGGPVAIGEHVLHLERG